MKKTNLLMTAIIGSALAATVGCAKKEDAATAATTDTSTIAAVPKASGPVTGSASVASVESAPLNYTPLAAATGTSLSSWYTASQWTASSSRAMCEVGMAIRDTLSEAMQPDKIGCYLGTLQSASKMSGLGTIDDGSYKYFKLVNMDGNTSATAMPMKMKIVKTGSSITTFEMFSCMNSAGNAQTEYTSIVIANGTVTLTSKNKGTQGTSSWGASMSGTGAVDGNYNWTSKTLTSQRFYADSGSPARRYENSVTLKQNASSFSLSGYNIGDEGGAGTSIFSNAFYAIIDHLGSSTPGTLKLGDGSAKYNMTWCIDAGGDDSCANDTGGSYWNGTSTDSWNGDTREKLADATTGGNYATVNAGTVPSIGALNAVNVNFSGADAWDCSLPAGETWGEIDLTDMATSTSATAVGMAACNTKFGFADNQGSYPCQSAQ